jgi:tRNA (mo5U34)-methyltransferase
MLHSTELFADLAAAGLAEWQDPVRTLLSENLREGVHGQLADWRAILHGLPEIPAERTFLDEAAVRVSARECATELHECLREQLLKLAPWRKGPFDICGTYIDSEWRSDLKWSRIAPAISSLRQRLVLDVGCGNGYYALRMRGLGAQFVFGIDPTLLFLVQFQAIQHYARQDSVHILPGRLADLPARSRAFDTTFSMGVLYHQRDPLEHLRQLHDSLRPGGELVLETLILPGKEMAATSPPERYARMRNVWLLPTLPMLLDWLESSGFAGCRLADLTVTTSNEQRSTEWMPYESLQQALDPLQPDLTVEGLPRPRRAVLVAQART